MAAYKVVKKIVKKGYPTSSRYYKEAHAEANVQEKKKYPKGYQKINTIEKTMTNTELLGTHTKSGKIKIEKKIPKKLRPEIAYHENKELKNDNRLRKLKRKHG